MTRTGRRTPTPCGYAGKEVRVPGPPNNRLERTGYAGRSA
jgi:hypothetical protein